MRSSLRLRDEKRRGAVGLSFAGACNKCRLDWHRTRAW